MHIRDLSKPTEFERSIQEVNREVTSINATVDSTASLRDLIAIRSSISSVMSTANNIGFCLLFNRVEENEERSSLTHETLSANLESSRKKILELTSKLELKIHDSLSISTNKKITADPALAAIKKRLEEATQGHFMIELTAQLSTSRKLTPIVRLHCLSARDAAGYEHSAYSIFFRGNREFATSFSETPPDNGWIRCAGPSELSAALYRQVKQDGFEKRLPRAS